MDLVCIYFLSDMGGHYIAVVACRLWGSFQYSFSLEGDLDSWRHSHGYVSALHQINMVTGVNIIHKNSGKTQIQQILFK